MHHTLKHATMKVYAVGGSVRDELMGLPVKDRDWVVVGGTAEDMLKRGFEQVGAAFPVFLHPRTREEYALARTERKVGEGYLGFEVSTEDVTLEQDLSRRDLTINAIARDDEGRLVDPFGGVTDLHKKVLRHVSDAFMGDPLRVVRLARFYARYTDFTIATETAEMAIKVVLSGEMNTISRERYWAELKKVLKGGGDQKRFFDALQFLGVFNHVEFFNSVFGNKPTSVMVASHAGEVARRVGHLDDGKDLVALIAASAKARANLAAAPSDVVDAHRGFAAVLQVTDGFTAADVMKLLKELRAVSRTSERFEDVLQTMKIVEGMGLKFVVSSKDMVKFAKASQDVPVGPLLDAGLTGKELGEALFAARLQAVSNVM